MGLVKAAHGLWPMPARAGTWGHWGRCTKLSLGCELPLLVILARQLLLAPLFAQQLQQTTQECHAIVKIVVSRTRKGSNVVNDCAQLTKIARFRHFTERFCGL